MAKIFRTEELSIGADKIRLTATSDGQFSFKKADGTEMLSNTTMDAEVTSLNNKLDGTISDRKEDIADKVSDLGDVTDARVSDIAVRNTALTAAITARTAEISSLNTKLDGFASDRVDDIADSVSDLGDAADARVSDIAVRNTALTAGITARTAEISSLNTKLDGFASDRVDDIADSVSGLSDAADARVSDIAVRNTALTAAIAARTAEISSLNTKLDGFASDRVDDIADSVSGHSDAVSDREGNVESLANMIGSEDVYAARYTLDTHSGDATFTANWDGDFLPDTDPVVCAMLRGTSAEDPILGVMISGAQTNLKTGAHFAFSDQLPNNNYELEILVSKAP